MILSYLVLAAALAVDADAISTDRRAPTPVWILPGARALDSWAADRCEAKEASEPALPTGMRASAHLVTPECGEPYVFLDLDAEIGSKGKSRWARTTLDGVSLDPPRKNAWAGAKGKGTAWLHLGPPDRPALAVPLGDPRYEQLVPIGWGEPLEVLDRDLAVLRTASGHEVVLSGFLLAEEDPAVARRLDPQVRALKGRFFAGRARWEAEAPLAPVPPSEALRKARSGRAYELQVDADWLRDPQYTSEWLEPVAHVLDHACDPKRTDRNEPCGRYLLDWSAFGAFRPEDELEVVAVHEGEATVDGAKLPRLKVLVREPWGNAVRVSPEWDGE